MIIRKMTICDYDDVYDLWLSCTGIGLNNLDDSKDGIDRFLKRNPDTCFVMEYENKIIGVIMAANDGRRGYIYHTSVNPKYQNQGIGSKLVDIVINELKNQGVNKVALVVFNKNEKGNIFWENQGFTVREDLIYRNKSLLDMIRNDT